MSRRGAWANVVYRKNQEMTRGDTATVTAAVTLNLKAPPSEVLGSPGSVAGPPVLVSCVISARLTAPPYDITVNDSRWEPRSFETLNTAHWIWYVGPKIGGTQTLGLFLQPVVQVGRPSLDYSTYVSADSTNTAYYPIKAHISVPLSQRIPELMSRLSATLKLAQGLVEAISGLIAALIALGAALGIRRIRKRKTQEPTPPDRGAASAS